MNHGLFIDNKGRLCIGKMFHGVPLDALYDLSPYEVLYSTKTEEK